MCHAHPSDGSLHLTLHPADSKLLLENGWGERHPLARGGWFRRFVPREFVLVYAPRNEEEVGIVMEIVAAAVWWVSGIDVHEKEEGKKKDREMDPEALVQAADKCWACRMHGCGRRNVGKMVGDS